MGVGVGGGVGVFASMALRCWHYASSHNNVYLVQTSAFCLLHGNDVMVKYDGLLASKAHHGKYAHNIV